MDISETLAPNSDQLDAIDLVSGPRTVMTGVAASWEALAKALERHGVPPVDAEELAADLIEARLAALREQVRRDEHLLAALGGDDTPEARTTCGAGLDGECYEDGCPQRDPATRTPFCPLPATGLVALRERGE